MTGRRPGYRAPGWLLNGLILAVTIAWVAAIVATILVDGYQVPTVLNTVFLTTLGIAFGVQLGLIGKGGNGDDDE